MLFSINNGFIRMYSKFSLLTVVISYKIHKQWISEYWIIAPGKCYVRILQVLTFLAIDQYNLIVGSLNWTLGQQHCNSWIHTYFPCKAYQVLCLKTLGKHFSRTLGDHRKLHITKKSKEIRTWYQIHKGEKNRKCHLVCSPLRICLMWF